MPRKIEKKERGVFEKEPGADIWWIRYYIDGRERREKVGRRGDAIKLYKVRKTDALRGVKLPTNMKHKGLRFKVIAQEAIDWYIEHGRKDVKSFRIRMNIILKDFGERVADDIKPSDIDAWLSAHKCAGDEESLQERVWQNIQERPRGWQSHKQPCAACRTETGKQRTHPVPFR